MNPDWDKLEACQQSLREHMAEIERLTLQRDAQAENATQYFDRANGLAIENKALRAENTRLRELVEFEPDLDAALAGKEKTK